MTPTPPWNAFLRPPATTLALPVEAFTGKSILITGAGGYIGSALARRLSTLPVKSLLLLDIAEFGLFTLDQVLPPSPRYHLLLGSVDDPAFLNEIFTTHRPDVVFHAAALKHVPLLEANPFPAAQTNILGTQAVAQQARQHGAQLILLSTDKAVDPHSVMGATKRFAELLVLAQHPATKVVRLPNILGSTGSVAPLFLHQAQQGKPLTVTDSHATRHFLSLETAVDTLLLAVSRPFPTGLAVPQVGLPYRIEDLAHFLLEQANTHLSVTFTGLRPGEKLHETMLSSRELLRSNPSPADALLLDVQTPSLPRAVLEQQLSLLTEALQQRNLHALLNAIGQAVPEYKPGPALRRPPT